MEIKFIFPSSVFVVVSHKHNIIQLSLHVQEKGENASWEMCIGRQKIDFAERGGSGSQSLGNRIKCVSFHPGALPRVGRCLVDKKRGEHFRKDTAASDKT